MRIGIFLASLLIVLAVPSPAKAACVAESRADRPHLVELYTAEGCSSCPPAEKWLSSLRTSAAYVGLEYHVDYWDSLGWHDPYADARFTERQRRLAEHGSKGVVYTPQIAVDGRVWKDWPKQNLPAEVDAPAPQLRVEVTSADTIHVAIRSTDEEPPEDYRAYAALTENGLVSKVTAGENRGKTLDHDMVVRAFAGPLAMSDANTELKPPAGLDRAASSVVAFVQDLKSGDIVQVVRVPLTECAR